MKMFSYFCLLSFYCISSFGYNVDTNFPIVYSNPIPKVRNSYFGYSILLNSSWIQIGAPRADYFTAKGTVEETGVAYHCKFHKPCYQLSLDKIFSKKQFSVSKGSWFGVAMDFQKNSDEGHTVVCGHRWMNKSESRLFPGACLSFQPNVNLGVSNVLTPTASLDRSKRFFLRESPGQPVEKWKVLAYKYALSQSGMSVHFLESGEERNSLLFGAPGFLNWKGSVVKCNDLATCSTTASIIDTYYNREIDDFDLFGYQVASGNFFSENELVYVASAPRDRSMKGYIMIYKFPRHHAPLQKVLKVYGKTTGEYFGSSLAVADVTGDGLDDLVVGAPFFSKSGDEGCIYILEFHKGRTLKKMERIEGMKKSGRFGSAVASVGDLDHDKCEDIAVGAPYEGNGAIYIYYGRTSGLKGSFQRITAESIHKSIRGFGHSFSSRVDIDENYHNDIAVGSYLSGHAVILRGRPVVTVNAEISSVTHKLSVSVSKAVIQVCVNFIGERVKEINVTQKISVDRLYGRAKPPIIQNTVLLKANASNCQNFTFNVKFDPLLVHQSMEFHLTAYVTNTTTNITTSKQILFVGKNGEIRGNDSFYLQDPIQRMTGIPEAILNIPYSQDCKGEICRPHLQLNCVFLEDGDNSPQSIIIGSLANYQLLIEVKNIGEPSYVTYIEVTFSDNIRLASLHELCNEVNGAINCQLGIVRNNSEEVPKIILDLDMSSIEQLTNINDMSLHINVSVHTSALDLNVHNNFQQIIINTTLDVDAYLYGKSHENNYPVYKFDNGSYSPVLDIVQIYEVHKKGISSLKTFELVLQIPVNISIGKEEIQVLSIHKPDAIIDSKYWLCSVDSDCMDCQNKAIDEIENVGFLTLENTRPKRSLELIEEQVSKDKAPPANRTLYINCSSELVKCTTIRCGQTEIEGYGKITLRLEVNIAMLGPLMGQKDIVYITSTGNVHIINPDVTKQKNIQKQWPHVAEASSTIIGKIPKKQVDLWIIVASVVGGILLAMLIGMGLAKAGFFRRQTKEDLQELKEKTRNSQIQPPLNSTSDEEIDNVELR